MRDERKERAINNLQAKARHARWPFCICTANTVNVRYDQLSSSIRSPTKLEQATEGHDQEKGAHWWLRCVHPHIRSHPTYLTVSQTDPRRTTPPPLQERRLHQKHKPSHQEPQDRPQPRMWAQRTDRERRQLEREERDVAMAMDVNGAGAMVEQEDIPACMLPPFVLPEVSIPRRYLDWSTPLPTTSPPLLRYHRPRSASRSSRLLREHAPLMQQSQAPYTDSRTGLRYHDKSVYDLIKNLARSLLPPLSSCTQHLTITSFLFAESQRRKGLLLRRRSQSHSQIATSAIVIHTTQPGISTFGYLCAITLLHEAMISEAYRFLRQWSCPVTRQTKLLERACLVFRSRLLYMFCPQDHHPTLNESRFAVRKKTWWRTVRGRLEPPQDQSFHIFHVRR